MFTTEIISSYR